MNKIHLLSILLLLTFCANSQSLLTIVKNEDINFEDNSKIKEYIKLDTNNGNIWRIGKPVKVKFNKSNSPDNAIITGLKGYYPPNTKSSFILKFFATDDVPDDVGTQLSIEGSYKIDSDSLSDYGIIEMSFDNGLNWLNILNDTFGSWYYENKKQIPVFTGNLYNKWYRFVFLSEPYWANISIDTLWFRFTFISDSIDTHKEGWMIDNLAIIIWPPDGINDIGQNKNQIIITPIPVNQNDNFTISFENIDAERFKIYDSQGKLHIEINNPNKILTLSSSQFQKGIYVVEILDKKGKKYIDKLLVD